MILYSKKIFVKPALKNIEFLRIDLNIFSRDNKAKQVYYFIIQLFVNIIKLSKYKSDDLLKFYNI